MANVNTESVIVVYDFLDEDDDDDVVVNVAPCESVAGRVSVNVWDDNHDVALILNEVDAHELFEQVGLVLGFFTEEDLEKMHNCDCDCHNGDNTVEEEPYVAA